MKKFLLCLLFLCSTANAQIVVGSATPPIIERQFYDDTYVHVPLQFGFPFYGRTFTNSWMHSNGVVSFLDPAVPVEGAGYNPGQWAYCCSGVQPTTTMPQFSYMIAPLWTDLYPVGQSRFMTQGDASFQRYYWENIAEISNMNNLNTFGLEIRPTGFIGAYYEKINIQNQQTWVGTIGDPTQNQWNQIYYGVGVPTSLSNWSMANTPGVDQCVINPLSSSTCAGYTETMCSANPLYSTSCSGYAAAYYSQQCSINSLFDSGCPGYAAAYLDYQCSANPLYSTACSGYEQAYFNQQCSINTLYNSSCPGYEQAYFDQQCSLDGLYSNQCPNYAEAYAKKNILNIGSTTITTTVETTTTTATPAVSSDGTVKTEVSKTGDSTVDSVISNTTTSATSTTATVQLAPTQSSPTQTVGAVVAEQKQEQKHENKNDASGSTKENNSGSSNTQSAQTSGDKKEGTKTARQELQEKREAAVKAKAVEEGKQLAGKVGEAASMEAQVAVQNVLIAAMGYTPGFQTYSIIMPDVPGYKPFTVYKNQKNVDNARMMRGLSGASDKLHEELVSIQYR